MADAALVDRLCPGDHVCWSFPDDAERRRVAVAYVRAGLRERHQVVYLAAAVDPDTALAELTAGGVDTAAAVRAGGLRVVDGNQVYLGGGAFDRVAVDAFWRAEIARADRDGYAGLRALGDMAWAARPVPGIGQLPAYEAEVNRAYANGYAMAVCLYDRRLFGEVALAAIGRAHPATVTPRTSRLGVPLLRMARHPAGLRLSGEADLSNREALAAVLTHAVEDGGPQVTLELSGLRFADANACELVVAAGRAAAGRLRIAGATGSVRRLLVLQGADEVPGLLAGASGPRGEVSGRSPARPARPSRDPA